ncbi:putative protein-serine/threonine phosphatase [Helianthus anomalus]
MGTYLNTLKTDKQSEDGENERVRYGLSSMHGWRATMEDSHAAVPNLDSTTSFFSLYDILIIGPHSDFAGPTSGCTTCVAIMRNDQLIVANAGDSRCVISRNCSLFC